MTIAPHADAVHQMVDRLAPGQIEALYVILEGMVGSETTEGTGMTQPAAREAGSPKTHRFAFIAAMDGEPDLAERSAQILRDELGDPTA